MAEVIRMPRMSDTMEEGNIVAWHKKIGDEVEIGDLLAEVETDKATMDFESPADGVLLHIAVEEGSIAIGGILAVIGEKGEDFKSLLDGGAVESESPSPAAKEETVDTAPASALEIQNSSASNNGEEERIKASPLARKMALDANLNLATIKGTGDNGRIVKKDVEAALGGTPASVPPPKKVLESPNLNVRTKQPQPSNLTANAGNFEEIPVSQMRKVIARRLGESKFTAPHFYLTIEIDMAKAIESRKKLNEIAPVKISFNDLVVKAAAVALRQHPNINSSWMGDTIRKNKDVNIGVAVAVEEGLLVPVVNHADTKTLSQINTEVREMAGRAKERKLQPHEMQGNTFTISNLGMFGIEEFTAIINPPDACILAVGSIIQKPVVKDGELAVGSMMKVTLSCDHRVVDGAAGSRFLQTFRSVLEDPIRMLV